jgi:hypothetical protein
MVPRLARWSQGPRQRVVARHVEQHANQECAGKKEHTTSNDAFSSRLARQRSHAKTSQPIGLTDMAIFDEADGSQARLTIQGSSAGD